MTEKEFTLDMGSLENIRIPEVDSLEEFEKLSTTDDTDLKEKILEDLNEEEEDDKLDTSEEEDLEGDTHLKEPSDKDNTDGESEEPLRDLAKWAHELGIIDYDEAKFENTEEYFKKQFFEKVKEEALQAVPEGFMEDYMNGVPLGELLTSKARQESYDSIKEESLEDDEPLSENLVAQWLELQDHSPEEIREKLENYKKGMILDKEAKSALRKLKAYEVKHKEAVKKRAEEDRVAEEKAIRESIDTLKSTIQSTETFIPGITMDKAQKEKLFLAITRRDREGKTELEKKMSSKEMQLAVAQFVMQLEGKVEAIERKATTKAAQKVKDVVNSDETPKAKTTVDLNVARKALKTIRKKSIF
jgi:hypothetical protein